MKYTSRSGKEYHIHGEDCTILCETQDGSLKTVLWKTILPNGNTLLSQVSTEEETYYTDRDGVIVAVFSLEDALIELTPLEAFLVLSMDKASCRNIQE